MTETHRHYWTHADDDTTWRCAECAESTETCRECGRYVGDEKSPSSLLICERCVRRWARAIDDVVVAISWYRHTPPSIIRATRYDRDRIRGSHTTDDDQTRIEHLPGIFVSWYAMWAEGCGDTVSDLSPLEALDWQKSHLLWAAHNTAASAWGDWKDEIRQALTIAKRDAGLLPRRMPAPCAHCNGVAVRTWAERDLTPHKDGLSDIVQCLGCGLTWKSEAHYRQLSKGYLRALPDTRPDTLATAKEAMTIWPDVPEATWRKWVSRGEMPDPAGWTERGVPQYRVGDLAALPERRQSEGRQGRKATA